jgi:hypothetical protein
MYRDSDASNPFSSFFHHLVHLQAEATEQVMDLTEMNHQEMLFQTRNLHRRIPHAAQFVQGRNPQVHPAYRGAQDTGTSVASAASSHQSSNICYPNILSGCADGSIVAAPEIGHGNIREASTPAYPFHTNVKYHHADVRNQAFQSEADPWERLQMDIGHSTAEESRENHRLWSTEAPQVDFPVALYVDNANADALSEAPNRQESDTFYYSPVLPWHQTQRYHDSPFHNGPEGYSHYGDPLPLALPSVHGAVSTVVPQDPSSSLRPTTIWFSYPSMGYGSVLGTDAVAANMRVTGSQIEIGDTVGSQFTPMLNHHQTPAIPSLPLPPPEMMQHMPNGFDHPADFKVSGNIGLEIVWDRTTGDPVPMRAKRSRSDAERASGQEIRRSGGQCEKCKKNKRKVCILLLTYRPVFC